MQAITYEEVINRVKALPVEALPSLMDYAVFLESRYLSEDALWQATTDQYRDALRARADEALVAHRAGLTREIVVAANEIGDDELTPAA